MSCRLCASLVERSRCTDNFGIEGKKQGLSSRLSALLLLPIEPDDRLSPFVCRSCKLKFNTLEAVATRLRTSELKRVLFGSK